MDLNTRHEAATDLNHHSGRSKPPQRRRGKSHRQEWPTRVPNTHRGCYSRSRRCHPNTPACPCTDSRSVSHASKAACQNNATSTTGIAGSTSHLSKWSQTSQATASCLCCPWKIDLSDSGAVAVCVWLTHGLIDAKIVKRIAAAAIVLQTLVDILKKVATKFTKIHVNTTRIW